MKLNVPIIQQTESSLECGIACLNMIYSYYQTNAIYDDLVKEFEIFGAGISIPQLGIHLEENGFNTSIITLNPLLFSIHHKNLKQDEIAAFFKERLLALENENDIKTMKYFLEYMEKGGLVIPKIPDQSDVEEEIHSNRPIIALLTTNFLQGSTKFNFHFNVITGIDENDIIVNDPSFEKGHGGEFRYNIKEFLFALYASSYGDMDNASLLLINKG